jgi:hypothetical protein
MYYYLVYIPNNTVRYALVHTCDGTTSTHVSNVVATKMNGTKKMLSAFTVSVQNKNISTGAAIANSNWNDVHFSGAIMVNISSTYTPPVPFLLFLPSSITF